jgi:hypothetical protein
MLHDRIGAKIARSIINTKDYSYNNDIQNFYNLIHKNDFTNFQQAIDSFINYYLTLKKPIEGANYSREEISSDFNLVVELACEYESVDNFISDVILQYSFDKESRQGN